MARYHIWNFHNPRISLAQSCMREVINHSTLPTGGASALLARVESVVGGWLGMKPAVVIAPGLAARHLAMDALGTVLDGIDQGTVTDTGTAIAAYNSIRASQPPATAAMDMGMSTNCLDLVAQFLLAWVLKDQTRQNEIKSEFTSCDPGWLTAVEAWISYYWAAQKPQYNPPTAATAPFPLPPAASPDGLLRVGVLGDWGTGEPAALAVPDQIMRLAPDLIIHLGDIYYAGTFDECQHNFLLPIQNARKQYGRFIPVYMIPGNHDYYSGGRAFYQMIPQLNLGIPSGVIQQHSFFSLQNDGWQLECMDTGYNDHSMLTVDDDITNLLDVEAAWHQQQLANAAGRRIILMSHHQLFSAFTTIGPTHKRYQNPYLTKNLADWRAAGASNIVAWLWGHEHLLEVYARPTADDTRLPVLGRCVGHGAFPIFNNQNAYTPKPDSLIPLEPAPAFPNKYVQTADDNLVYANGFAMLTLGAALGKADYYQVNFTGDVSTATSEVLWTDELPGSV